MSAGVLSYLRHLLPTVDSQLSDGELLRRFAVAGDQAAFTELLRRHGPLVWGVCRRVLRDAHDAEDAFQATFLQLARRAASLRRDGSLAGWLHTVATRLAGRAARAEQRRRRRDRVHAHATSTSADELTWRELQQMLDREIARLPEPYRQPLILCYLENRPQIEAAHRLGITPGVLRGRLERGRQKLRQRLEKLGLPLAATLLLTRTDPVPAALGETTCRMVFGVLTGGPVPRSVAILAAGGTFAARLKLGVVTVVLLVAGGISIGEGRRPEPSAAPPPRQPATPARPGVDALGDPLPPGAIRRLGTERHRVQAWPVPWQDLPGGASYLVNRNLIHGSDIRRLDAATGRVLETWPVPKGHHVAGFSANGRYALMANGFLVNITFLRGVPPQKEEQEWVVILYDLVKRKTVWEKRQKREAKDWKRIDEAYFSADGKWIATTGEYASGMLCLWDAATGKELWERKQEVGHLTPLGFADNGAVLVLRERNDSSIYLLDRATGKERRTFRTMKQGEARQGGLSPDGSAVLLGWVGPSVRVWDLATGREQTPLDGHKDAAHSFAFSPDGKTVVTGGDDSFVLVRAWPSGEITHKLDLGRWSLQRMAISGDGRRLEVLFTGESTLHFYDLQTGKSLPAQAPGHKGGVWGVAGTPDGRLLSFGSDATVLTWDVATGKIVGRLAIERDHTAATFAVSSDGRLLATPSEDNQGINIYEGATGKRLRRVQVGHNVGNHVVLSPDGRFLANDQHGGRLLEVWDVSNGRTLLRHECVNPSVYWVPSAFSPDGRQFAVADYDTVRLWDTSTWKEQTTLAAYASQGLAYSPDGRTVAAASVEGVRLFELASHQERVHLRPDGYPSGALHFSPTGSRLAWVNGLKTIHVWDATRGEMLASFAGHDGRISDLAFPADERALVSASDDSTLLVWDLAGPAAKQLPPRSGDMSEAWKSLAGEDAKAAYEAIRVLASNSDAAVPLLARHLKPAAPIDRKRIEASLRDLDSSRFEDRERAMGELQQLGEQAEPAVKRFLADRPSLEARRRVEQVLEKVSGLPPPPERLREVRALEALERMGSGDARRLVETLAKGAADARLTRDAEAALARMRREASSPRPHPRSR